MIGQVFRSGREFVCNNTSETEETARFDSLMLRVQMRTVVVLPLMVDAHADRRAACWRRGIPAVADEELAMLREVAGNLSFGLQYLQRDNRARFLSHFDPQTGLAKRPLFCERVQRMVAGAGPAVTLRGRHPGHRTAQHHQRLFGRRTGDLLLLQHVADRLKQHFPQTDQIAHFGAAPLRCCGRRDRARSRKSRRSSCGRSSNCSASPSR